MRPTRAGTGTRSSASCSPRTSTALAAMGSGHNVSGAVFTTDGNDVQLPPSPTDHFPDVQTNVVPIQESMGAYNALQQSDVHSYWEFNYQGTNWIHPLYELPFTGGLPGSFEDGDVGALQSIVPGPDRPGRRTTPVDVRRQPAPAARPGPLRGLEVEGGARARRARRAAGVPRARRPERARERDLPRHLRAPRLVRAGRRVPAAAVRRLRSRGGSRRHRTATV